MNGKWLNEDLEFVHPTIAINSQNGKAQTTNETFPIREGARDARRRGRKGAGKKKEKRKMNTVVYPSLNSFPNTIGKELWSCGGLVEQRILRGSKNHVYQRRKLHRWNSPSLPLVGKGARDAERRRRDGFKREK